MAVRKIIENVYEVGTIDWDRRLFDELIPLPEGTSYNSYIIKGSEKTALIDAVDPVFADKLRKNLDDLKIEHIDYVICNHAEQDHSGTMADVLSWYPEAMVVTNSKCKPMLIELLHIPEDKFIVKGNGETISLGNYTLEFIIAPWVHWPETMLTWLVEEKILFSCDLFGSHLATSSLYSSTDLEESKNSAKRYFAEIMMPFSHIIPKHLEAVEKRSPKIIAPSHGPLHNNPEFIINCYKEWTGQRNKKEIIVAYVSMHNSTKIMADALINRLLEKNVKVRVYNLTVTDIGELAMDLVDASALILGTPTVLGGPHPAALYAAHIIAALRPKLKFVGLFGSYGWGGKTVDIIKDILSGLKPELLPPAIIKGMPRENDLSLMKTMAEDIAEKLNNS